MNMLIMDTHQHYWQRDRFQYPWLTSDQGNLYRDFLPEDVYPAMKASAVSAAIAITATHQTAEANWLLGLAATSPFVAGVVGWINPSGTTLDQVALDELATNPLFKGIRLEFVTPRSERPSAHLMGQLARLQLVCDLLVEKAWLPEVLNIVQRAPDVVFVLDHLAGLPLSGDLKAWREAMLSFAKRPNVNLKLSGYLTGTSDVTLIALYIEQAFDLFGAERLMFGSDWPICTRVGAYGDTVKWLDQSLCRCSLIDQNAVWRETAKRVYKLM